jgi:hypothetical protein
MVADMNEGGAGHIPNVPRRRMLQKQKEKLGMENLAPKGTFGIAALSGKTEEVERRKYQFEPSVAISEEIQALPRKAVGVTPGMSPNNRKIVPVDIPPLGKKFPLTGDTVRVGLGQGYVLFKDTR